MVMRFVLAQLQQESNSFSPISATLERFKNHCFYEGQDMIKAFEGTNTEMGGFIQTLSEQGADMISAVAAGCVSCGPVADEVCDLVVDAVAEVVLSAGRVDGVLVCLHGAMLLKNHDDGTGYFLSQLRERLGNDVLIAGSLDFHGNITQLMLDNADILLGYKTYPHIDLSKTGQRVATLAIETLLGLKKPVMRMRKLPMILNGEASCTNAAPMCHVMARAAEAESQPGVLDVSVFQVQSWMNVSDVGCAILVTTDGDESAAEALSRDMAAYYWGLRKQFVFDLTPVESAIAFAMAHTGREPVIFADSADGTGSGSPGDSPQILKALLAYKFPHRAYLTIVDKPAVKAAMAAGIGQTIRLNVGGTIDKARHSPLEIEGYVKLLHDGSFILKGPQSTGQVCRMGRTAVIQVRETYIVLMENSANNWDPSLYRALGLEPLDTRVVVVKSPAAFRAAYKDISTTALWIDVPGASSANLHSLLFDKIKRPMFPFDDFELDGDDEQ